jgi:hypothetical protein
MAVMDNSGPMEKLYVETVPRSGNCTISPLPHAGFVFNEKFPV